MDASDRSKYITWYHASDFEIEQTDSEISGVYIGQYAIKRYLCLQNGTKSRDTDFIENLFQFYREIAVHILKETQNIFNKHESPSYIYILNYLIFIQEKPKLIDLSDPSVAQGKFSKFETF